MGRYDGYETVKSRKKRFYEEYKDGRIVPELITTNTRDEALFRVSIYKNADDQMKDLRLSTGYAHEIRVKELSRKRNGDTYASVNYTSWIENCEESAVGRALDNAGFASNMKCSREEIEQAEKKQDYYNQDASGTSPVKNSQRTSPNTHATQKSKTPSVSDASFSLEESPPTKSKIEMLKDIGDVLRRNNITQKEAFAELFADIATKTEREVVVDSMEQVKELDELKLSRFLSTLVLLVSK